MKKMFFTVSILVFVSILIPQKSFGSVFFLPFGGKVITNVIPGVVCPGGEGPIIMIPSGLSPASLYVITPQTIRYLYKTILPNSWILGLYSPTPLPLCSTTSVPPIPILVFPIIIFGSSFF